MNRNSLREGYLRLSNRQSYHRIGHPAWEASYPADVVQGSSRMQYREARFE